MSFVPTFPRYGQTVRIGPSEAAIKVKRRGGKVTYAKPADIVAKEAARSVLEHGGDTNNVSHVLAMSTLQFGVYRGQTFKWVAENDAGWVASIVIDIQKNQERETDVPLSKNKFALMHFFLSFPEGEEALSVKRSLDSKKSTPPASGLHSSGECVHFYISIKAVTQITKIWF